MFDAQENTKRLTTYRKDPDNEAFLQKLNRSLLPLEKELFNAPRASQPAIFIFGLPRSGTTLLYQLISYCCDVGYPDHLIARFWKTPLTGIKLSRHLFSGNKKTNFSSNVGLTEFVTEPHEFGYFWADQFGYTDNRVEHTPPNVDWESLAETLDAMGKAFGRPVVYKNLTYAFHLGKFSSLFDSAVYVYVKRNLPDTAVSILNTRKKRYGTKEQWWSVRPPNYEQLCQRPYWKQIPYQMHELSRIYEREIDASSKLVLCEVTYEDLCNSPLDTLQALTDAGRKAGFHVKLEREPPSGFSPVSHEDHEDYNDMRDLLDVLFSN